MFGLHFNPFKSWTVGGVLTYLVPAIVGHFDPSALGGGLQLALHVVGTLAATIGARNAVAKAALAIVSGIAGKV